MTTAKTEPTQNYSEAGREQAQGQARMEAGDTVAGKQMKAEGVADAQHAPSIDMNDVSNVSDS